MDGAINNETKAQEKRKLKKTIETMKKQIETSEETIKNLYKNFDPKSDDPYVIEHLTAMYAKKSRDLDRSLEKPYFARIDFKENKDMDEEELYIGKCSVMDDSSKLEVIDWRTPVASLYYDGRLGNVSYDSPEGEIQGQLLLKRVYDIEKGELQSFSDVDITANDELLKPYLSAASDNRLKNIISTIQSEQNKIIRAKLMKPLIVQGVAGSGKTTVALHRIAYLAYAYEKQLKPEDFLIIAPNKFFLDYISAVLPDLGVDDVSQLTFEEFAKDVIGNGIIIENSNDKLANIVNNRDTEDENDIIQKIAQFKSSLKYKELLDKYLNDIEGGFLPDEDLKVGDIVILSKEKLQQKFMETSWTSENCLKQRFDKFTKRLSLFIQNNQEKVEDLVRIERNKKIQNIDKNLSEEEYKKQRMAIFEEYEPLLKKLNKGGKALIAEYSKKASKTSALEYYKDFIKKMEKYVDKDIDLDIIKSIKILSLQNQNNKKVEYEDLAPLMYLTNRIFGTNKKKIAKHIVIDEAQDYSVFQFLALKDILDNESITILGDIAQGIYSYRGTNDWNEIKENVFDGKAEILELGKSYRTTMEIMNKGNDVISKVEDTIHVKQAEPVIRRGVPVNVQKQKNIEEEITNILERIKILQEEGSKNIAVITKTLQEAKEIAKRLEKGKIDINMISDKAKEYKGGVSVIPSYLVKGLEFDSVILSDANNKEYANNELDAKLLYIAITRAMRTLDIFYTGQMSELLEERKREEKNVNIIDLEER